MKTDIHGCSTCEPGQEKFEEFKQGNKTIIQYDYRNEAGELFSTVANSLNGARSKRDEWIRQKTSDKRAGVISAFMKEINAKVIREESWPIYKGKTIITYATSNGKELLVMKMMEGEVITFFNIYLPADQGSEFDPMFNAVREYLK